MGEVNISGYKKLLLDAKNKILNHGILTSKEDLHISAEDLADETDLATSVINQQVTFNMRKREMDKLRAIEEALYRVEDGSYGSCEECGEFIGEKRLKNQPWAFLCIVHAEERERERSRFIGGY
ncbi:MAG: TraR/DksA family transcriptional regulator [Bacteriovoracaceae bacterium]|nr:TraR/DksA family transcriptional regulator [Bacteriovoracaceae bacterium]